MSTPIDSLELEIKSSSQSAADGIDQLAGSLERLRKATQGGLGLTSVASQLEKVSGSVEKIGRSGNNMTGLTKAILTLKQLGNIKVSASIGNQIKNIGESLSTLQLGDGATKILDLVSALKPLETLGKSSLGTTVNALNKLPEALKKIDTRQLYTQIQSLTRIFQPLGTVMQQVANGFNAFPSRIQRLIASNDRLAQSNQRTSTSYINLWAKMRMAYNGIRTATRLIASAISKMNDYIENVNLFTASMGEYAGEAKKYAEQVGEIMGIDPGEWMRNQGVFMTLATGFGVASDKAYIMSKNLTQLTYDMSSFFNMSYEDAAQKLQSALAGELEPVRRVGYDLSQAALKAIAMDADNYASSMQNVANAMSDTAMESFALNNGINKAFSSMTQAEKSQLRYIALMKQVTMVQGDMARTLNAPANQLRIFTAQVNMAARAIGSIFIPMLNAVLPVAIAVAKVIRLLASTIASLFGFTMPEVDYSDIGASIGGAADAADSLGSGLGGAADNAKKLQKYTMGFDELNVIDPSSGSGGSGGSGGGVGGGFDFDLPEYDFLGEATQSRVDGIVESLQNNLPSILSMVSGIAAAFAAWKIHSSVIPALEKLATLNFKNFKISFGIVGLTLFLADLEKLKQYMADFQKNGASFYNVSGMISTFAGLIGDALILLGNLKLGGALKIIEGIGQIVGAVYDISKNGVNWNNVTDVINGLSNVAIGIGVLTKNMTLIGVGMSVQGLTMLIEEIATNWEAIKKGDWSGVDKATLVIGAIEMIAGIVTALGVFNKVKQAVNTTEVAPQLQEVTTTLTEVDTQTSTMTSKLTSLAKNLGLGLIIIAEVAIAAGLFIGAIWGIGLLLEQVGIAWQPVLDNGGTIAIAIGIGTGLLVGIGVATALLGTLGWTVAGQIGIGMLVLIELGIATGLFLAEIWAIGVLLNEIGIAWQPVLDNGQTIAVAIGLGTGLLVGIGVVTAALGAATVASVGALPIAIGLGTALLVQLSKAFKKFCDEMIDVANKLSKDLAPAIDDLNDILPDLTVDLEDFIKFMTKFADLTVEYTKVSSISGFATTVDTIIGFFTKDPIQSLADDVKKQYDQSVTLNDNLDLANPELNTAISGLTIYKERLDNIKSIADTIDTTEMATNVFSDMVTASDKLADFGANMADYYDNIKDISTTTMSNMVSCVNDVIDFAVRIKDNVDMTKLNNFIDAIEDLATAIKKLPTSKTVTIKAIYQTSGTAPGKFATGGFPETGQMFVAREAGPELVGNIGNRTAVVNNEQIVASVSRGVASANSEQNALLREQNSLLRAMLDKETGVYLDGKQITQSVEKYQSSRGRVIVTGGVV